MYHATTLGNQDEIPSIKSSYRIAIIIFLAIALPKYRDFSHAAESNLADVTHHLEQKTDDSALSPEHLLWSLIRLSFVQPKCPLCFEFWVIAVRMTTAWKGLEVADRQAIHALLWLSLGATRRSGELDNAEDDTFLYAMEDQ
jgi:hypothetical protein